jgi:hypothetical protein
LTLATNLMTSSAAMAAVIAAVPVVAFIAS